MLELFKIKGPIANFILLLYTGLVCAGVFNGRPEGMYGAEITYLGRFLPGMTSSANFYYLYNVVILFCIGLAVNYSCSIGKLAQNSSLIPGALAVGLLGSSLHHLYSPDLMMGCLLIALASANIMHLDANKADPFTIFNISFFLGTASMFFLPVLGLFLPFIAGIALIQQFNVRTLIQFLLGIFCPYVLTIALSGAFSAEPLQEILSVLDIFRFSITIPMWSPKFIIYPALFFALFFMLLIMRGKVYYKRNVMIKRKINVLYLLMCLAPVSLVFQGETNWFDLAMPAVFLAALLGVLLSDFKNKLFAEAINLLIMATLVFLQHYLNV